jgi:integrase
VSEYDVKVYALSERTDRGGKRSGRAQVKLYRVRWVVDGTRFERSFTTNALADSWRSKLVQHANAGSPFDGTTGLPRPMIREENKTTWYQHARTYVDMKWPHLAAKSRRSMVDALATVTPALVSSVAGAPDVGVLRTALYRWAFNPGIRYTEMPVEVVSALDWLSRASVPLVRLKESDIVRAGLSACARTLEGKAAAATTSRRKRAVFYNALGYAVEREVLDFNPIDRIQWKAPAVAEEVDRRVVANTAQVEAMLAVLPDVHPHGGHLVAFFGCIYYAAMRPSEVAELRLADCYLPETGWGRLLLAESASHAGAAWTDDGETRQRRGLKHRASTEIRPVPIPPALVALLRTHIEHEGLGLDGRIFRAPRGGYLSESLYGRAWSAARGHALTPPQAASPLVARPYDLRHAGVTLWLNAGVPAPEVARRAGHGVGVLLKVYAGCIDGEEHTVNARIEDALQQSRASGQPRGTTV